MPAALIVTLSVFGLAIALAVVGLVMSMRGTGSLPQTGGWLTIIGGLVAACFGAALVVMLIAASMDDVPGLW